MIRYKLTDGTYMDVDPMFEQIFLAGNDGAVVATDSNDVMVEDSLDQETPSWQDNAAKLKAGRE